MALGGACPALSAVPKISRILVPYLAGLIVVTPYIGGTSDASTAGFGEAHASSVTLTAPDAVLKVLKLATDAA